MNKMGKKLKKKTILNNYFNTLCVYLSKETDRDYYMYMLTSKKGSDLSHLFNPCRFLKKICTELFRMGSIIAVKGT